MPDFRVMWTALPRWADASHIVLDVFASPRLGVDEPSGASFTLADFPEVEDWPEQVANQLTFKVEFSGGQVAPATRVPLDASESAVDLDEPTWQALFPPDTPVEPWTRRSPAGRPLYSFPADYLADYLHDTYQAAGRKGHEPTRDDQLDQLVEDVGDLLDTRPEAERAEPTSHTEGGETTGGGPASTPTQPGCLTGCLLAPVAWIGWILRWLWHALVGGPGPGPAPQAMTPPPPPISVTPKVVTYEAPPRGPAPVPPAIAAVEAHVAATGVTPAAGWTPAGSSLSPHAIAAAAAWRFYRRPESEPPKYPKPDVKLVPPSPGVPDWDFHRRLGALGDYPVLMRRLGIVVRLRVARPAAAPTTVRVIPSWGGLPKPARDLSPRTRCSLAGTTFMAEARTGSDLKDGVLDLAGATERTTSPAGFRLLVVDTDGAILKVVHTAASIVRQRWLRARGLIRPETRREGLSSLRTAGIMVVRSGRASAMQSQIQALDASAPIGSKDAPDELFADDLVRGFRVDVQDVTDSDLTPWRSLCHRVGTYHLLDGGTVVRSFDLVDHGYLKRSAATSADAAASPLYVHEALVRWDGWSLVAPRPGRKIKTFSGTRVEPDGTTVPTQDDKAVVPVPEPNPAFHLATVFRPVDGTLPMLRVGRTYRFRLPWVDLAGEGMPIADTAPISGKLMYRRFEPVAPPTLLPLDVHTPGESLECLVIRSAVDRDAVSYAQQVLVPVDATAPYRGTATRHVFPPKVTQEQAEQHGMLDSHDLDWRWRASLRADNTFETVALTGLADPTTSVPFGQPASGSIEGSVETYSVNREDATLPTPYLPDPTASAVALRNVPGAVAPGGAGAPTTEPLPGTTERVSSIPFDGAWPEVSSFRIRLAERPGTVDPDTGLETFVNAGDPPAWDAATRLLTIFLAKGEVATIPFSTVPDAARLTSLGPVSWLDAATGSNLARQVGLGGHWMVSPARSLTLVHAVQRPLRPASFANAEADRDIGATVAMIRGRMALNPDTTGNLTLLARWTDEADDEIGPTLVATSLDATLDTFTVPLPLTEGTPADTQFPPVPPVGDPVSAVDARHEFGDTRHRVVKYRLRASTRFREYFPAGLAGAPAADGSDGFSRVGAEIPVSVPNSAPPTAPGVRYLMPSFGWDVEDPPSPSTWMSYTRVRSGGGVRVFLDRPWFTSGPGEQLGVVLAPAGEEIDDKVHSRLGVDPTWEGTFTPTVDPLDPSMFSGGDVHLGARLENNTLVDVVGFNPTLDIERNQWFADVTLDMAKLPATYWPFIRLALARFQPESVVRAAASKIVVAEYTQLLPDREFTAKVVGLHVEVAVRGRGPRYPSTNLMLIALDEATNPDPDELAWRPVGSAAIDPDVGDSMEARINESVPPVLDSAGFRWEKTLPLPPGPRGSHPLRVIVRELEFRETDQAVIADLFDGHPIVAEEVANLVRRGMVPRVVYADAVRLG